MHGEVTARKVRLAYVVSHPIQYQANLLRRIAADPDIDLTVFFCSDFSAKGYQDKGFGVSVQWDVPLLSGYRSVVLPRWRESTHPSPTRPISRGFLRELRRGIDGKPFDAVWIHGYSTVNSLHAILAAKALGLPVILRAESWLADRKRSGVKLMAKRLFFRILRSLVDAVLPIGTQNTEYWSYYFGGRFPKFLVPYAVDNDYFASRREAARATRADLQKELGLDPSRPVILFASKLQERKHADHLLEAYLQLRQQHAGGPEPYLVIVGDGEMRQALEHRAAESGLDGILFAGFRNQSELPRFFDLSAVFVLPSRHEAWGLITNEAMAAGLPVIVTDDVGCAVDLVRNGENGFVYPVGNIAALRDALRATLEPGRAEAMGQRSREILSTWSYREDQEGLRAALRYTTGQRLNEPNNSVPHEA
jgi:glycosyltransferase involved in cell wall biosynthesis